MCQPPELSLPGKHAAAIDQGACSDWSYSADAWSEQGASDASPNGSSVLLPGQRNSLLFNFEQNQIRERAETQFVPLVTTGRPATSLLAAQQQSWASNFHQDLTQRLQRAAQAATAAGKNHQPQPGEGTTAAGKKNHQQQHPADGASSAACLPWMKQQLTPALFSPLSPGNAPAASLWAHAAPMAQPVAAPLMPRMTPALVAQGIPFGVPLQLMGQMDPGAFGQGSENGEGDDDMDPKKYKRMMSNRASAKRSRQRRQERLDELEIVSAKLQVENATVQRKLNEANERIRKFQEENEALLAELQTLKEMAEGRGTASLGAAATMTKQDSCEPNGSTSGSPSTSAPSTPPSPKVTGKRRRDEAAESRFFSGSEEAAANGRGPVTPTSDVTSDSDKGAGCKNPVDTGVENPRGTHIVTLDDELFTSLLDEYLGGKPH